MSQRWEISKVSTPEHVLKKIFLEVESPGILVFGADPIIGKPMRKCDICDEIKAVIAMIERLPGVEPFFCPWKVLGGEESCDHTIRHKSVTELHHRGAKNVVGIYVKEFYAKEDSDFPNEQRQIALHNEQVATLLQNPPTPDGLAYLITISEEDE